MSDREERDFVTQTIVRFGQVDAAGIVFYPRFFEMLNAAVEDWFAGPLGTDFATLHQKLRLGVPTAKISVEFLKPCRLGDVIDIRLRADRLGQTSADLSFEFRAADTAVLKGQSVFVCVSLETLRPVAWPDDIRAAIMDRL